MSWLDDFFRTYYARRPVNATFIGVHAHDHRLPDGSENGAGDTLAEMRTLLRSSEGEAGLDARLARGWLRTQIAEFESPYFHRGNPGLYTGEAVFGVMSLLLSDFAPVGERLQAAIERMHGIPVLLAQARAQVRVSPVPWTERALRECRGALAFFTEGIDLLAAVHPPQASALRAAGDTAARAFTEHTRHLESMQREPRADFQGCGEEMLSLLLREGHFLEQDATDIAAEAEARMPELRTQLEAGARQLGFATAREALAALAGAHPTVDGYLSRYQACWDEVRRIAEAHALLTWPDFPIRYVPRPAWARAAAPDLYFLFYRSPATFARPPVHDYLVTPIDADMAPERQHELLRATNDAVIKLNHVIHHGGIGHHVQNWHAYRAASRIGQVAAVDCAARIAMYCGGTMAEGWACYATDLMAEHGALTPLEQLSELQSRLRMCARAIVDVRMHLGRLSIEDAAGYYLAATGMSEPAAISEAVKNSMFPGTGLMYLAGRDAIHALRRGLQQRLGARFTLRAFHDEFLSFGSVPVAMIAREMQLRHASSPESVAGAAGA